MSKVILSIDAGKHTSKAIGSKVGSKEVKELNFRTKLYDLKNGDIDREGNSYSVKFEGGDYIIGDQGEDVDNSNTKTTLVHKLAVYVAITQVMDEGGDTGISMFENTANIVIGCPANIFKNKVLKEEYRNYIKGDGIQQITVNEKQYSFTIEKVVVKCEGSGIVYMKPELFRHVKRAVIDLGGKNMNFAIYENMVSIPSTIFSNGLGSTSLETDLKERLQVYTGEEIDIVDAEYALKNGGLMVNGELDEKTALIVQQSKKNYVRKVTQEIKAKGINLSTLEVSGVGGTSVTVQTELEDAIKHIEVVTENAQTISVEGFYKVAIVKFQKV